MNPKRRPPNLLDAIREQRAHAVERGIVFDR